jgi:ferredoxin
VDVSARIRIDPILCRGHAICALFFSDGVDLDQWGFGKVTVVDVDSPRDVRRARRAAAACPNGAFVVTERVAAPSAPSGTS